jgi:cystathionine gamma-synthase
MKKSTALPLGAPIPDASHAVSVSMPLWEDVVRYEEGDLATMNALASGYPRFVIHSSVEQLFRMCSLRFAKKGERCMAFATRTICRRAMVFVERHGGYSCTLEAWTEKGVWVLVLPDEAWPAARLFWQHTGEIVSSRMAEAVLGGALTGAGVCEAEETLRTRIAGWTSTGPGDVFLFPSGMAALACAHRVLMGRGAGGRSVQFGFPYVDSLKLQEKCGAGEDAVEFFAGGTDQDLDRLGVILDRGGVAGVFCEFPTNPLLHCVDMKRLSEILRPRGIPLVVDDSMAPFVNVDLLPYADILVSSLTKYVCGEGTVMAGSLVISPHSRLAADLIRQVARDERAPLYPEDAMVLERASRDYQTRMSRINETTSVLVEHLASHPRVAKVFYPELSGESGYRGLMAQGGGFGGVFSLVTVDPERHAQKFHDALEVLKGPSFGMNVTLSSPYTLLAHYHELEWAERCGVSKYLIRVSVGLEDPGELISAFDRALVAS